MCHEEYQALATKSAGWSVNQSNQEVSSLGGSLPFAKNSIAYHFTTLPGPVDDGASDPDFGEGTTDILPILSQKVGFLLPISFLVDFSTSSFYLLQYGCDTRSRPEPDSQQSKTTAVDWCGWG